ncbi:MAG: hypothetical protein K9M56_08925 [Victivallales bacterium]|nr:hypothetical protein [Victivallales bacterium]
MPYKQFDRTKLSIRPLSERANKVYIERDFIPLNQENKPFSAEDSKVLQKTISKIKTARLNRKPVILAFGAHAIKNGLAKVFINLIEKGWITHLATNGAGIIHDWEFAYQGESSEDVKINVDQGQFGIWDETGFYINLAIILGAFEGLGYGESVGAMIENEYLKIPEINELQKIISASENYEKTAAAADLLNVIRKFNISTGKLEIRHKFKEYSVQGTAYRLGIPFTGHPMFGHDIIYTHPMNYGAAVGRTAQRDFLIFANQVNCLEGGVYLSVGSAVMSPMIFEKSLSMSQNLHLQKDKHIDNHYMLIVDLAENTWDWSKNGEPPMDNPAYYLRYCKTFNRMGGTMNYITADNRDFLLYLNRQLNR